MTLNLSCTHLATSYQLPGNHILELRASITTPRARRPASFHHTIRRRELESQKMFSHHHFRRLSHTLAATPVSFLDPWDRFRRLGPRPTGGTKALRIPLRVATRMTGRFWYLQDASSAMLKEESLAGAAATRSYCYHHQRISPNSLPNSYSIPTPLQTFHRFSIYAFSYEYCLLISGVTVKFPGARAWLGTSFTEGEGQPSNNRLKPLKGARSPSFPGSSKHSLQLGRPM